MKEDLPERLEAEVKAYKRYVESSVKKPKESKIRVTANLLDIAGTAKKCADRVHGELWGVSKGNLTDEELQFFTESETLERELEGAHKGLNIARQR